MIDLKYNIEQRKKEAFYCSDYGKLDIELYYGFKGEPYTNPPQWNDTLKWGAGKGVEMAMLDILKMNGIVKEDYEQEKDGRVEMEREGVKIHGYIDAIGFENNPIEIKSINNKNSFDIKKYENGEPRESYVAQLSMYMDFLGKDKGYLFVSSIDGLNYFWFECNHIKDKIYKCGNVEIDLSQEYKRWKSIYDNHIVKDIVPECSVRYKIPIKDIDWKSVSKGDIGKARNGNKVIGDPDSWKITYSNWKDKIIELQGVELGYTQDELLEIKEATKGFTTWK